MTIEPIRYTPPPSLRVFKVTFGIGMIALYFKLACDTRGLNAVVGSVIFLPLLYVAIRDVLMGLRSEVLLYADALHATTAFSRHVIHRRELGSYRVLPIAQRGELLELFIATPLDGKAPRTIRIPLLFYRDAAFDKWFDGVSDRSTP